MMQVFTVHMLYLQKLYLPFLISVPIHLILSFNTLSPSKCIYPRIFIKGVFFFPHDSSISTL